MTDYSSPTHDEFRNDVPEYVLGILDGRDRAALLTHVEHCDECSDAVQGLSSTSDALLHVPVGVEPPVGFESRVLARIDAARPQRTTQHSRGRWLGVAAAVIVVSGAIGIGVSHLGSSSHPSSDQAAGRLEQRSLIAGNHNVGEVMAYAGKPAWMFVTVDVTNAPNAVRCIIVTKQGVRDDIGTFSLSRGQGSWGTALPVAVDSIRTVELTTSTGAPVARLSTKSWRNPAAY